jgi:hypothetical protein
MHTRTAWKASQRSRQARGTKPRRQPDSPPQRSVFWQAGIRAHERLVAGASPSHVFDTVALDDAPLLIYRCGGSAGLG